MTFRARSRATIDCYRAESDDFYDSYLNGYEQTGVAVAPNFHRPLSASYVNETIRLGCDIVELVEPQLQRDQIESDEQEILTRIPNFIVIAARRNRGLP